MKKLWIVLLVCVLIAGSFTSAFGSTAKPLGPMESLKQLYEISQFQQTMGAGLMANGANAAPTDPTGTITINNASDGATLNGYQLVLINKENGQLTYNLNTADYQAVFTALNVTSVKELTAKSAAEVIAACITSAGSGTADITGTASGTTVTISDVPYGLYYMTLTPTTDDGTIYNPMLQMLPTVDTAGAVTATTTANAKKYKPVPEKEILENSVGKDETTASIGDKIQYKVTTQVPKYTTTTGKITYKLTDTMSQGLTYNYDMVIIDNAGNTLTEGAGGDYTLTAVNDGSGNTVLTMNFDYQKLMTKPNIGDAPSLTLTYSALLNEKAAIGAPGNPNAVTLTYTTALDKDGNSVPDKEKTTDPDKTTVYSFGLDVTKYELGNTAITLPGAKFTLSEDTKTVYFQQKTAGTDGRYLAVTEGDYVVKQDTQTDPADPETYTATATINGQQVVLTGLTKEATTGAGGKLVVDGLGEGTYTLTETQAPSGYFILTGSNPLNFTITGEKAADSVTYTGNVATGGTTGNEAANANAYYQKQIANNTEYTLPGTGGIGTYLFFGAALLSMTAACLLLYRRRTNRG